MTDTAIQTAKPAPLEPMAMIQLAFEKAIEQGAGLEVVDRILAQQRQMMEYRDAENFNAALRRIQDRLKPIRRDSVNPETHSKYASAGAIDDVIEELLQDERMSLSFEPEAHPQPDMVRIVGVLSLGAYSKRYPLDMPADGKGAKGGGVMSRTHATGSAITYGKRYLKNMIFNLRFREKDDDGNRAGSGGGAPRRLDERDNLTHLENIRNAGSMDELQRLYLVARKAATDIGDVESGIEFERAKNQRINQLRKEGNA
jgi:hypothetical protein